MTTKRTVAFLLAWMVSLFSASAQSDQLTAAQIKELAQNLKYKQGAITIQDGLATLNVPTNFFFLDANDAKTVLVKFWGNPPAQVDDTLGLLIPAGLTPLDDGCWVVTISYTDEGYVKDDDASKINYDDLMKKMKEDTESHNKERTDKGYPAIHLIGWATPPHYDAATHKLYWAKDAKFDGEDQDTLNYDIRILGRHGVLVLTAVAAMNQLPDIEKQTSSILGMVDFNQGNRYADFNPKVDKVAAYGIAALVAGGIAAKVGLLKFIWVGILAAKKFIIIGVAAVAAWFRKLFKGRQNPPPTS